MLHIQAELKAERGMVSPIAQFFCPTLVTGHHINYNTAFVSLTMDSADKMLNKNKYYTCAYQPTSWTVDFLNWSMLLNIHVPQETQIPKTAVCKVPNIAK